MAANLQSRGVASFGKLFVSKISSNTRNSASLSRRGVHVSVYDKNPEEHAQPSVVPDEVIQPQSDKYWAPHPQTGVFGPDTDNNPATASGERGFHTVDSVLEEKAFFRPLEDLEKPQVHP
ncbi:late embryogenesis abundant protein At5g17165-like [Ipomoea triloba]|uniref:late embryogenesis abundant protein At5g17165-like n=1 Tax=Ipomoea triloba TaxID=35885 RepID=UPI00125D2FAE|nr:late embryogenesis abundant protein At5g17165-like [Ipomoea triloba]GLL28294.1 uncharacterized protein LOC109194088 [Ipomoea trifida]GMC96488.1 late embryogenesis abundant protein At5g17165-like isoform X1 [Ipomoea batatas]GMD02394.1 late embryogenesis abundant protein At5g17165-like isoform X1 [Ipomoea batatas]GMD20472.1 late embryogenesis abundant protein At5g17165-like isoform X1 [Ipomoea batatas]GME09663.1 late embryogenesis abundant protein At5g17165-like isoform X1 [Ipomoea batatas]